MHELLTAIGIESIPPGETEASLVKKILADNFFFNKVLNRLVEEWSVGVAERLPQLERDKLRSKFVPKAIKKPTVAWGLVPADQTTSGKPRITATGGGETIYWTGTVEELRRFRFRGEAVPANIIDLWEQASAPMPDPLWIKEQRERERWAKADKAPKTAVEVEQMKIDQDRIDRGQQ